MAISAYRRKNVDDHAAVTLYRHDDANDGDADMDRVMMMMMTMMMTLMMSMIPLSMSWIIMMMMTCVVYCGLTCVIAVRVPTCHSSLVMRLPTCHWHCPKTPSPTPGTRHPSHEDTLPPAPPCSNIPSNTHSSRGSQVKRGAWNRHQGL